MPRIPIPYANPVEFKMEMHDAVIDRPLYYAVEDLFRAYEGDVAGRDALLALPVGGTHIDTDGDTWTRIAPTTLPQV